MLKEKQLQLLHHHHKYRGVRNELAFPGNHWKCQFLIYLPESENGDTIMTNNERVIVIGNHQYANGLVVNVVSVEDSRGNIRFEFRDIIPETTDPETDLIKVVDFRTAGGHLWLQSISTGKVFVVQCKLTCDCCRNREFLNASHLRILSCHHFG